MLRRFYRCWGPTVNSVALVLLLLAAGVPAARADREEETERARRDEARLARIVELVAAGEYAAAQAELDAAGDVAERDPRWLNLRGLSLAGQGRDARAVQAYEAGLRRDPTLSALHRNLAISLVRLSARGRALTEFRQATELDPADAEAWLGLAELQMALGRLDGARESLDRLQELRGDDPRSWRARARLAALTGDEEMALAAWTWLEGHHPDAETARRLGALGAAGPDSALARYRDCIERDREAVDCREQATRLALEAGDPQLAVQLSAPALEALSEAGYLNLLIAAQENKAVAEIEGWVERRRPASAPAWGVVALVRRADGRGEGALAAVRSGLELAETADLYNLLGVLRVEAGDAEAARAAWRKALEIDPGFGPARQNLAEHPGSP